MDSKKPRKRDLVISLFKRKEPKPSPQSTSSQTNDSLVRHPPPSDAKTADRERARAKYLDSVKLLEKAVKSNEDRWGSFDFPGLKGEPEDVDDSLFREKINTVMDARKNEVNDRTAWAKCMHAVQCAFTAFSPFAKNFLTIAKEGQAVFTARRISHQ
jgi:hypothetical protein